MQVWGEPALQVWGEPALTSAPAEAQSCTLVTHRTPLHVYHADGRDHDEMPECVGTLQSG